MKTALAITHVAYEDLGSLAPALTKAGFDIRLMDACTSDLHAVDALAPDLLVMLGGPIGVYEREAYPFIDAEIELLRTRLAAKLPTLGICLGAQLMAAALGARVYPGTQGKELGWSALQAGAHHQDHPWFSGVLMDGLPVLHWHGDTFDLPAGAVQLAATPQYAHQAFALENHALALQFHPEVTPQGLECWYVGNASELAHAGIDVVKLRAEGQRFCPAMQEAASRFWEQWLNHVFAKN
ncbi:glutamine amidotransferase [Undibacterium sp. TJN19]|uniref:glutamine amidotransferase n=1 Tax=Undibacterium sp. TJN19 TaxID=3413055 RepID=UPI003BF154F4